MTDVLGRGMVRIGACIVDVWSAGLLGLLVFLCALVCIYGAPPVSCNLMIAPDGNLVMSESGSVLV